MISGTGSSALVWIKLNQWCGDKGQVFLKVPGEELYWSSNCVENIFDRIGHSS